MVFRGTSPRTASLAAVGFLIHGGPRPPFGFVLRNAALFVAFLDILGWEEDRVCGNTRRSINPPCRSIFAVRALSSGLHGMLTRHVRVPIMMLWLLALAFSVCPLVAHAAAVGNGPSEVVFLFQLVLLILFGRLLGEAFIRLGQSAVTGQLIAGILLGPSALGVLWPEARHYLFPDAEEQRAMLNAVSQVGILLLLLLTGMDTDLRLVRRAGFAAASISITGIVVPFVLGFALGEVLPDSVIPKPELRVVTSLFLGAGLAIASIKIVAMVVREMNYMRRILAS